jgi:hypothetical protein
MENTEKLHLPRVITISNMLDLARTSNPHYLDIMSLFDVARRTISEMVNEESPRRIFEILNVHEDEETSDEKRT